MDWKSIVGTVAPYLGTALAGPLGGAAMETIANALGLSEKTEAAIKGALSGSTPETLLALKLADNEFAIKMKELGFANLKDMEAVAVTDRASARQREISLGDLTARNLAYAITAGFFGVLGFLLMGNIPDQSRDILNVMLGSLGTAWVGVNAYYFGSTKGSQAKTEMIAKAEALID